MSEIACFPGKDGHAPLSLNDGSILMAGQAPIHDECAGRAIFFFTFRTEKNNMVEMGHSLWWAEKPCAAKAMAHSILPRLVTAMGLAPRSRR